MDPSITDWISAVATAMTTLFTAGLLLAAVVAGGIAAWTLWQMRQDSKGQREDSARATRPYVYPRIAPGLAGERTWDLVVENTGRTAAYDLRIDIDAPGVRPNTVSSAVQQFAEAGAMLPPGSRIRMFWALGEDPDADPPEQLGYPRATVTLAYTDSEHQAFQDRPVVLDSDALGLTPAVSTGAKAWGRDAHQRDMLNALRAIARHVGEGNR